MIKFVHSHLAELAI